MSVLRRMVVLCACFWVSILTLGASELSSLPICIEDDKAALDKRIVEKYGEKEARLMLENDPQHYKALKDLLDFGWYVTDFPVEKADNSRSSYKNIKIKDIKNLNVLMYDLSPVYGNYQYYRINEGDQMLVIRSKEHIAGIKQKSASK